MEKKSKADHYLKVIKREKKLREEIVEGSQNKKKKRLEGSAAAGTEAETTTFLLELNLIEHSIRKVLDLIEKKNIADAFEQISAMHLYLLNNDSSSPNPLSTRNSNGRFLGALMIRALLVITIKLAITPNQVSKINNWRERTEEMVICLSSSNMDDEDGWRLDEILVLSSRTPPTLATLDKRAGVEFMKEFETDLWGSIMTYLDIFHMESETSELPLYESFGMKQIEIHVGTGRGSGDKKAAASKTADEPPQPLRLFLNEEVSHDSSDEEKKKKTKKKKTNNHKK